MGTRGAYGILFGDYHRVAYNHYDSYPSGLGLTIYRNICTYDDEQIAGAAVRIQGVTDDIPPTDEDIEFYVSAGTVDPNVGDSPFDWYALLRHSQGDLGPLIEGKVNHYYDGEDFLLDSLFCEWAYIINMNARALEVYRGFNREPNGKGRYADGSGRNDYYGVRLIAFAPLEFVRSWTTEEANNAFRILETLDWDEDDLEGEEPLPPAPVGLAVV